MSGGQEKGGWKGKRRGERNGGRELEVTGYMRLGKDRNREQRKRYLNCGREAFMGLAKKLPLKKIPRIP